MELIFRVFLIILSGVSESTRINTLAIQKAGIQTALYYCKIDPYNNGTLHYQKMDASKIDNPFSINLIHINYDSMYDFFNSMPPTYFQNKYNIGFWAWEFLNPPVNTLKCLSNPG
jgi:hypothetical protein